MRDEGTSWGICDRGATQPDVLQRQSNAAGLLPRPSRPLRPVILTQSLCRSRPGGARPLNPAPRVVVVAAVVEQARRILVTERPAGTHLAGHWEFPGGKAETGENHRQCLEREMREELDVVVTVGEELLANLFHYPDRTVELHFYRCEITGKPTPRLGQRMRWMPRTELGRLRFPPADRELVQRLAKG